VTKSAIDTFLIFADTTALIGTMNDLENAGDSVLKAFEDEYGFVSMRKFYEDKLNAANDTFEQKKWEDRPVEMNEFATVVSPSGLIQVEDTLYLIDVEGGAMYFTQTINSNTISLLKSKAVSDPAIDSVHLGNYSLLKKRCNESQASYQVDNSKWKYYINYPERYRYKIKLSYWDYGLWFAAIAKFKHRKLIYGLWVKSKTEHSLEYDADPLQPRCKNNKKKSRITPTKNCANRSITIYSSGRSLHRYHITTDHFWTHPANANQFSPDYQEIRWPVQ